MSLVTHGRPAVDEIVTVESFAELSLRPSTLTALTSMGIEAPTPIQAAALPALLGGRDLIGQARTGSGKTLAFGIPAAELVDVNQRIVQVLVLTPTRELAVQVGGVLDQVGGPRGVVTTLIFGGRAMGPQRDALRRGAHVVVGTPGRVLDLLNQGALRLDRVRFLVLDEADEMLDRGFAPDVERIMSRAQSARQTALFSATVPDWVRSTASKHLNDPVTVAVDPNPEDAAPIDHVAYDVPNGDKLAVLKDLLDHRGEGSIIVFGRTKHGVKKLAKQLQFAGYPVEALQGNLSQNARDAVMDDFRAGRVRVLLATNVAARGLDITSVDQVINFELPESPELLTHRVGRTGRMGRKGQALTLLGPDDGAKWRQLERGLGRRVPRQPWAGAAAARAFDPNSLPVEVLPASRAETTAPRRVASAAPTGNGPRSARPARHSDATATHSRRSVRETTSVAPALGEADDVSQDQRIPATHDLIAAHARDPHRPAWAGAVQPQPNGAPRGRTARTTGASNRGEGREARASHEIVCTGCGSASTVRFRPDPTRPVYCDTCFQGRGSSRRGAATAAAR
ncbi:MAG: ATP-dependent helicase DeaD [Thermomicrobiales bacterium]|nr:ATP-dependent helicase DeaD [Thermomicrobiales bacterium]